MKALMVGLGAIGQRHLRNLKALTGADTKLLAYRARGLSQVVTDRLDVMSGGDIESQYDIQVFNDLSKALAERPDVTFICNPSSLHVSTALDAARAGSHLFIEKPLSHTAEGIEDLASLVERRSLVALVGYQLRFHPGLRALHHLLEQGAIGRVLAARIEVGEYLPDWHRYEDYRQSYASIRELGGGAVLSQIHELDYACWLFGLPVRVFAVGGHLSSLDIDVEDVASILMECRIDGRTVPVHVHQDYMQRPASRTCQVIGDAGKILVDLRDSSLAMFDGDGRRVPTEPTGPFERNQLFLDEMSHFLACVRGEQTPIVSIREGARSLRIALAARESIETGRIVEVSE